MTSILKNATEADLAAAVEENLFDLFRAMCALPESELIESEKLSFHHTFPSNPMFKGVWRTHLADHEVADVIRETLAWYKARRAPYAFWWTSSRTQPANLSETLLAHGFDGNIGGDPGMGIALSDLPDSVSTPNGFTLRPVER